MANTNPNPNDQGVSFDEIIKSIQGKDVRKALEKDRKPVSSNMKKETVKKQDSGKIQEVIQEPVQEKNPQKNTVKRKRVKNKSTGLKTNIAIRRDIVHIIRFKYKVPANQFIEKLLLDAVLKKFPEYKDELLKS